MICKFCAKNSIFTNKVNKCSHCAGFVDSFGGCLPRLCEMHHDAHVTFFNCCCSEGRAAKGHFLASHGTLFDAAVGTFPMLCGSKVLGQVPISRFKGYREIHRDTLGYRDIQVLKRKAQGYREIHRDTLGYTCIPVYPGVSPCVSLDLLTTKFLYLWQTLEGSKKVFLRGLNHGIKKVFMSEAAVFNTRAFKRTPQIEAVPIGCSNVWRPAWWCHEDDKVLCLL